ncbi:MULTISPECIES: DUF6511 domain-containing protein [Rhodobacterales]|uniref:Uncharacterized protein n=3 Tax=Rhodobacterales TaxID=204455 RepID=A0A4R6ANA0_9RHOB|nr:MULTISPECIES: DUF6511 domain-containing protein [Rhodobacterales]MDR5654976.1 DUF6511 domain-containing protein [Xinfangfangia sp. LG-4]TDL84048.1 hypothetical protein E2L08_00825 [Palleronia sediminis]
MSHVAQIAPPSAAAADRPGRDRLWHLRPVLCAVCTSRARGFGWFDPHRPRPTRNRRWFCSMGCQAAFTRKAKRGLSMVDFTEEETQALPAVMRALAPEMERIGWDRPLGQLTQNDMHRLIVLTVEAFRAEMAEIAAEAEIPF